MHKRQYSCDCNAQCVDVADRVIRLKNGKIIENVVNAQPKNINEVNW